MKRIFLMLGVIMMWGTSLVDAQDKAVSPVKDVSIEEGVKLIKDKSGLVILDVRTAGEYEEGHLKGATLVDYTSDDFEKELSKLDRSKPYLVHCAVGGRSRGAVNLMKKLNFTEVYHLEKGYKGWVKSGQPVTR